MGRSKIRLIVLLTFLSFGAFAQVWQAKTAFGGMHRDDACAFYNFSTSCGFVGTGMNSGFQLTNDFWKYDTQFDSWTQVAALPGPVRQYACGTQGNQPNVGYVFGGLGPGNSYLKDLWAYDYTANSWSQLASVPVRGRMGSDMFGSDVFSFQIDYLYLMGGRDSTINPLAETWRYNRSSDTWLQLTSCPVARWNAAGFYTTNRIYFGTGVDSSGIARSEIYEYNPALDAWSFHSSFPGGARQGASGGVSIYGSLIQGYIAFGRDSAGNYLNDFWFGPPYGWSSFTSLPDVGRKGVAVFGYPCDQYFVCGIDATNMRLNQNWNLHCTLGIEENETLPIKINTLNESNYLIEFNVSFSGTLKLIDVTGQTIRSDEITNLKSYTLNLESFSKGLYLIHLKSEDGKERVLKVVRQ